jgi:hypothetical protein
MGHPARHAAQDFPLLRTGPDREPLPGPPLESARGAPFLCLRSSRSYGTVDCMGGCVRD